MKCHLCKNDVKELYEFGNRFQLETKLYGYYCEYCGIFLDKKRLSEFNKKDDVE